MYLVADGIREGDSGAELAHVRFELDKLVQRSAVMELYSSFEFLGQFPGSAESAADFRVFHWEEFGDHYAETLRRWRARFWENVEQIRRLGLDERFIRTWHYYMCYCEAGFREREIGVSQVLLTKPCCRRPSLVAAPVLHGQWGPS